MSYQNSNATQLNGVTIANVSPTLGQGLFLNAQGQYEPSSVSGTGDVTGAASSVDGEVALFSGTTGKAIKRATGTGLAKITSGVLGTATAGTDYLAPAAIGTTVQAYSADTAFRTDKLSAFAATTSAELAGVISDETGSGALVFGTDPTFTTRINVPEIKATSSSGVDVHNSSGTQVALFGAGGSQGSSLLGTTNIGSASADYLQVAGGTGGTTLTATGSSTDINISLVPKGTGSILTPLTLGSVPFIGTSGALSQDNSNYFWDNTNKRLGVLNGAPLVPFDISTDPNWTIGTSPTPTVVASDTGGTVPASTYYFKIVATFRGGFAAGGTESAAATITTSTGSVAISWTPVAGASFYQVFRTTVSGTYTSPSQIATTSASSFTWTDGVATSGTPVATNGQTLYGGKSWINDIFTSIGTQYSSATINSVSALTANDTNITNGFTVRKTVPAANTYNHGIQRGQSILTDFSGSGTSGAVQGLFSSATYRGTGASSGQIAGASCNAVYTGTNTITIGSVLGVISNSTISSNGRATNLYGGLFTGSVASSGSQNPTAGTVYGVRGDATHTSTGKTVDAMYASYGLASATSTGGTATRIQGGFFQASAGNGSGGGAVSAPTLRGVESWGFQNVTATSSEVSGALLTGSAYGIVSSEVRGAQIVGENQSTVATVPLLIGSKSYALNYQTADQIYGSFSEVQHLSTTTVGGAVGMTTAVINQSTGTITDARGYNVSIVNASGTITNGYGVFIGTIAATNAWGIYQQSSSIQNHFGSKVLIGRTSDDGSVLQVEGMASIGSTGLRIQSYGDGAIYPVISRNSDGGATFDSINGGGNFGHFLFKQNGTEVARINGNGRMLINTTTDDGVAKLQVQGDIRSVPSASITPTNNGDLVVEATSNTSLTFKYKGSDGTVRTASLTLS
jgi:hypothetical protein